MACGTSGDGLIRNISLSTPSKMTEDDEPRFRPALIVVDMQEDFCPPVSQSS